MPAKGGDHQGPGHANSRGAHGYESQLHRVVPLDSFPAGQMGRLSFWLADSHFVGCHFFRFKFPQIKPHPWHKVFRSRTSQEARRILMSVMKGDV